MEKNTSNSDISPLSKEIGKGSFFFGIAGTLEQILSFLLSIIISNVLSLSDYGFYGQINSYYSIVVSFTLMASFRNIIIKHIGNNINNRNKINQIISTHLVYALFSISFTVIFFSISFTFNLFFESRFLLPLLIISTNSISSVAEIGIVFVGLRQFKTFNVWKMIYITLHFTITLIFMLIFNYFTKIPVYYGIYVGITVFSIIEIGQVIYFLRKYYGHFWNPHLMIKEIMVESIIYGLICIISGLFFNLDILLLANFISDPTVANTVTANFLNIQKTGLNFSRIISILIGSMLTAVLTPLINNKDYQRIEKIIGKIVKVLYYIMSSLMIIVAIAPKEILLILYGVKYMNISPFLYFSFFIAYYSVIGLSIDSCFIIANKLKYLFVIEIIKTMILLMLSYPLMSIFSPFIGMLITLALSLLISIVFMLLVSSKILSINYWKYIRKIIFLGSFVILFAIIAEYFFDLNFITEIGLILIVLIVYNVLIILTGVINKEDIQIIKNIFQNEKFGRIFTPILKILDKIPFKEK